MLYLKTKLPEYLFLDIETTAEQKSLDLIAPHKKQLWLEKHHQKFFEKEIELLKKKEFIEKIISAKTNQLYTEFNESHYPTLESDEIYRQYAPLLPEFGKIFCVSFGCFEAGLKRQFVTLSDLNEIEILTQVVNVINSQPSIVVLGGYNVKKFDLPFLIKRLMINGIEIPKLLQFHNKKPWEINILDVCEDYKGIANDYISLDLLCEILNIPSPKDEFKNSEMNRLLYKEQITLRDVEIYCEKDTNCVMSIVEKFAK